ncbi:GntR family transcriptional regulator [Hydrogenoanaerobacterium sp.]|uniref:GntR family transcriptional regulator n=1 Tax=Hydrogenoanaerobacterium sp. TaxID=2953763 RepID=UPI0028A2A238|nr:GntR family transcriptional regulator [Hydrogenoanaerobacterium sp.]
MAQGGSLKNKIYNSVLSDILQGNYTQDTIISEKMLIEKYQVSKSPVRDALIELCNEGILRSIPRYGYELVRITETDIQNIIEYRMILESECVRIAAKKMLDQEIDELEQYTRQCCSIPQEVDIWKHWDNNIRFHLRLNSYAQNQYIYDKLKESMNILTRAYAQMHWNQWHKTEFSMGIEGHLEIIRCIRARDSELAVKVLKEDISRFGSVLLNW